MLKDYFKLAYLSVRKRKLRSWLTMIGIFIGIAAVVALISLSQGLQNAILEQFTKLGSDKLLVQAAGSGFGPPGTAVAVPLTNKDKNIIDKVKGVDLSVGRLIRTAKLEHNDEIKYTYLISMPQNTAEQELVIDTNSYKIEHGRLLDNSDKYKILLGHDFSVDFFDKPLELRDKIKIQNQEFSIVGILKKSGNPQQDSTIIVPESTLREVLQIENDYDVLAIKVESGENIFSVAEQIKKELRSFRNVEEGKEDFSVQTPENVLATLNQILLIVQAVLIGIAAISLVVGGIGIMNTMYTAVLERTKEIGIMKATGARNSQISYLFIIESGMLGLFGGIIGVSLGMGISKLIELIAFQIYESYLIRADFNLFLILGSLTFAFLIGAFSGAFPAMQAANLKPVEALRK